MREGHRFCGRCGHELNPAVRFCGNCGHSVPDSADQAAAPDPRAGPQQAPDAYAPTITAGPDPPQPAAADDRPGGTVLPGAAGRTASGQGRPPPAEAPPGTGPPLRGAPAGTARRPALRWPLAAALAVLVTAGGTVAALFLTRHSPGQPSASHGPSSAKRQKPAVSSTAATRSPSPSPPPTQVNIQGATIGIGAVNTDPDATDVATTLATYFEGIDTRNYTQAWDAYTPALQAAVPFQPWSNALSTTQDSQVVVQRIQHDPNGDIDATVLFQSHQAGQYGPNPGETCTNWSLDYQLAPSSSAQPSVPASSSVSSASGPASLPYLIDKVTSVGAVHTSC